MADVKFRRQFPIDKFILDFYAPEHRLAIEADGGQHYQDGKGIDGDRDQALLTRGIKTLRFSNAEILQNISGVCEMIIREIETRQSPSPQSSPRGERR